MNKIKLGLLAVLATAYSSTTIYADPTLSSVKLTGIARTLDAPATIQPNNTDVWVQLTITSGASIRTEEFTTTTNEFGQFSVNIGDGTPVGTTKELNELVLNNDTKVLIEIKYAAVDEYKVIAERKYLDIVREMPASMDGVAKTDAGNTFTGNQIINGTLDVTGTTTFDSELVANSTLVIGSDANDVLTLKSLINGSLLPKFPGVPTIGSNDARWNSLNLGETGLSIGTSVENVAISYSASDKLLAINKDVKLGTVTSNHNSEGVDLSLSGNLEVAGTIYGDFTGAVTGTADKAKSLDGNVVGSIPYQGGSPVVTQYLAPDAGKILVSGAAAPEYKSVSAVLENQSAIGMVLTGGFIDNTSIGFPTPSTGVFTDLTATRLTLSEKLTKANIAKDLDIDGGTIKNTIIGASGSAAATFTDLTVTGNIVLTNVLTEEQVADNLIINGGSITNTNVSGPSGEFEALTVTGNTVLGTADGSNTITVNGIMTANGTTGSIEANSLQMPFAVTSASTSTLLEVINSNTGGGATGKAAHFKGAAETISAVEIEHDVVGSNALKLVQGDLELASGAALINNPSGNSKTALEITQDDETYGVVISSGSGRANSDNPLVGISNTSASTSSDAYALYVSNANSAPAIVAKNSGNGLAISVPQFSGATQLAYGFPATYNSETEVYTPRTNGSDCTIPNNVTVFNLPLADAAWNLTMPSSTDAGKLLIIINEDNDATTGEKIIQPGQTATYVSTGSSWVLVSASPL